MKRRKNHKFFIPIVTPRKEGNHWIEANQFTDRENCKNRKRRKSQCGIRTKSWEAGKGHLKKKGGISAPEIISELNRVPLSGDWRLFAFGFGNNLS
jgi:hypothetical protein